MMDRLSPPAGLSTDTALQAYYEDLRGFSAHVLGQAWGSVYRDWRGSTWPRSNLLVKAAQKFQGTGTGDAISRKAMCHFVADRAPEIARKFLRDHRQLRSQLVVVKKDIGFEYAVRRASEIQSETEFRARHQGSRVLSINSEHDRGVMAKWMGSDAHPGSGYDWLPWFQWLAYGRPKGEKFMRPDPIAGQAMAAE